MKKPLLSLALILATSLAGFAQTSGTSGDLTWTIADDTLRIRVTHATNTATMVNFSSPGGVTDAPWGTVENRDLFSAVVIEERVTSIGIRAFVGLTGLTSVTIGTNVTTIRDNVFWNTGLTSIIIPDNVTSIGGGAFGGNGALTSATIGTGVTRIENSAFISTGLTSIIIPDNVTSIGQMAFARNPALTSVTLGTGVTTIENGAFQNTGLTSIIIPDNVTSIGQVAFADNPALTSVTIGTGVTTIGQVAFANNINLSSITVHRTIPPTIDGNAFSGLPATACLHVPEASISAYRTADGWQVFSCVEAIFVAVANITNVPTTATAGTPLTLTGTVNPSDAINQTIVWSVQDAGTTGATINGNTLNTTSAGTVTVRATIANGATATTDFTQDFNITVTADPTSIVDVGANNYLPLQVHPNPFTDQIHITNAEIGAMLYVLNANGSFVHTQQITSTTQTIWLGHLPNGVYILRIGEQSIRIVKQ
ncbi:MAG: leucine-rich repeat protein [Bacteroidales bacterium]|nr:leucine-rich repeat protein [Bacteroidales bacterium]